MNELSYCAHQQNVVSKTGGLVSLIVMFLVVKKPTIGVGPQIQRRTLIIIADNVINRLFL
jgi:hypothetical protein